MCVHTTEKEREEELNLRKVAVIIKDMHDTIWFLRYKVNTRLVVLELYKVPLYSFLLILHLQIDHLCYKH